MQKISNINFFDFTKLRSPDQQKRSNIMDTLAYAPILLSAAGYSLVYLLAGGGIFGAIVIFIIAKMLGR
jgi:hypothetical protein